MSSSPWDRLWNGDEDVATPVWGLELERGGDVFIAVGDALGEGDEDVATPFHAGEVSRCARHGVDIRGRRKFPVRFFGRRVL